MSGSSSTTELDSQREAGERGSKDGHDSNSFTMSGSSPPLTAEEFLKLVHPEPQGFVGISAEVKRWGQDQFRQGTDHLGPEQRNHERQRTKGLYFTMCEFEEPRRTANLAPRTAVIWAGGH